MTPSEIQSIKGTSCEQIFTYSTCNSKLVKEAEGRFLSEHTALGSGKCYAVERPAAGEGSLPFDRSQQALLDGITRWILVRRSCDGRSVSDLQAV